MPTPTGQGLMPPWRNFLRSPQNCSPTYPLTGVLQSCAVLTAGIGIMSTLLDIPSLNIGDLQSEGITSLKEGIEVPSNCSVVKRKRKRKPNNNRPAWQFKHPPSRPN